MSLASEPRIPSSVCWSSAFKAVTSDLTASLPPKRSLLIGLLRGGRPRETHSGGENCKRGELGYATDRELVERALFAEHLSISCAGHLHPVRVYLAGFYRSSIMLIVRMMG